MMVKKFKGINSHRSVALGSVKAMQLYVHSYSKKISTFSIKKIFEALKV